MPRVNQPQSLYHCCKLVVNLLISNTCKVIELENGLYSKSACQSAVSEFQSYLLANIPGHVLDDLCGSISWRGDMCRKLTAPYSMTASCPAFVDPRTLLSVYMHTNMHHFSVEFRLPNDDAFWLTKVCDLRKVVKLDLKMVCTDEILEVISQNCRQLEEINIISKSESCECSNRTFNALKLKYFISDNGLRHLCQCKNLKRIEMNKTLRPQCAGRMMTQEGIKDVIKSLPKLEYISYYDVGTIVNMLVDQVEHLPLLHIYDSHSDISHINAISKLCPNLRELFLTPPILTRHTKKASDIIQTLTDSDLKVKVIEFKYFPIDKSLGQFLKYKGMHLTSLSLTNSEPLSSDDLILIGMCCPNVENIHVDDLMQSACDYDNLYLSNKKRIFTLLRCLSIKGTEWLPHIIVPIFLRNTKQLINLSLVNCRYTGLMDDTLNKLLEGNTFNQLKCLYLDVGCLISFRMLVKLATMCPQLMHLSAVKHTHLKSKDVANLMADLQNKNMNIELLCTPSTD